jgi:DNA repair protein RadC
MSNVGKPASIGKNHQLGRRQRLRERFLKNPDALPDYELLEMVLFAAYPRGDTKILAKELLHKFGSLSDVLHTAPHALLQIDGIGEAAVAALKAAQICGIRMLQGQIADKTIIGSWKQLLDYIYARMAYRKTEELRLLFLDNRNQLLADEQMQQGTIDHAPVYAREIVKRALEHHASAVIMIHNHPNGDPNPSKDDIAATKTVQNALAAVHIHLHDHLIIGRNGHKSLKSSGVI